MCVKEDVAFNVPPKPASGREAPNIASMVSGKRGCGKRIER